jgi:hypothetical protein
VFTIEPTDPKAYYMPGADPGESYTAIGHADGNAYRPQNGLRFVVTGCVAQRTDSQSLALYIAD